MMIQRLSDFTIVEDMRDSNLLNHILQRADRFIHDRFPGHSKPVRVGPLFEHPPCTVVDQNRIGGRSPVITADHVSDYGTVDYVADPFLLPMEDEWHLYYEIYNSSANPTAVIGHSVSEDAGETWQYQGIALDPGMHVSFPFVVEHAGAIWMLPNLDPQNDTGDIRLYKSDHGRKFVKHSTLVRPEHTPTDRILFQKDSVWWLFIAIYNKGTELHIYQSDSLSESEWTAHIQNPVKTGEPRIPGGSPIIQDDRIVVFFQNGPSNYGERVEAYEIMDLTLNTYTDRRLSKEPVIGPSSKRLGWDSGRMHTFDAKWTGSRWVCTIDGDTGMGSSIVGPNWAIDLISVEVDGCSLRCQEP